LPGMISGGPDWLRSNLFDIQALIPAGTASYSVEELAEGKAPKLQSMIQSLMSDRFKLTLQRDSKEMPGFSLTVTNPNKLKLSLDQTGATPAVRPATDGLLLFAGNLPMSRFAILMQSQLGKPVIDKTGLNGLYDFLLPLPELSDPIPARIEDLLPRKLEDLGLKLEPGKVTVDTLIIEHVEKPTEN